MAMTNIEKVLAVFDGISAGDTDLAVRYINRERFIQHNPYAADGAQGLEQFIRQAPREQLHLTVVRAFEDGPYVVTQATGQRSGRDIFFDVFRFDDELIVEHWAFSTMSGPPNPSGHTQIDGPTKATNLEDTERNKRFAREYYQTFHISGDHSQSDRYFTGELMVRHEPGVRDGVGAFLRDVEVLMQHRTIDEVKILVGEGNFVFIAAQGSHEGKPCVYVDLYRIQDQKIVEHWGFPEMVPPQEEWKNSNGML